MSVQPYQYQPPAPQNGWTPAPVAAPQPTQVQRLGEWAQAAQAAHSVAESLVKTSFVPEAFKGKAYEATAAILAGSEVGLSPMASLRSFDIIQGTAAPRALTLRAIVQSVGHHVWVEESTDTRAVVRGKRSGSNHEETSVWTIERARSMQLTNKANWKNQPKAMLVARATSEVCRLIAADAILGLPYSVEEIEDQGEPGPLQATAEVTQAPARTARRKTAPTRPAPANTRPAPAETVQDGPPLPGEEEVAEPNHAEPSGSPSHAQQKKLHALFREAGLTDRDRGLRFLSVLTGREIGSSKELTVEEASNVIDHLERLAPDDVAAIIDGDQDDAQLPLDEAEQ
jgi:hypothetical protein